jgi:hypothetical protein
VHLGARVRRILHLVVVTATAVVLALPLLLGPGANAMLRAIGAEDEHRCACGMRAGKCGCPECERLEHQKEHEREMLRGHAVLKSSCEREEGIAGYGSLPVATAPLASILPRANFEIRAHVVPTDIDPSLERARPPTPPPRSHAAV